MSSLARHLYLISVQGPISLRFFVLLLIRICQGVRKFGKRTQNDSHLL